MHACGTVHNECARAEKEGGAGGDGGGKEGETREEGVCGSVNRGKDAPAVGWMLLFEFLSSKREPRGRHTTRPADGIERDVKIDNGL